jgi:hypothetical protein
MTTECLKPKLEWRPSGLQDDRPSFIAARTTPDFATGVGI